MAVSFPCPHCGAEVVAERVPPGAPMLCRTCRRTSRVPGGEAPADDARTPAAPPAPETFSGNLCPSCGAGVPVQAAACPSCGLPMPRSFRSPSMSATGVLGQTFGILGGHFATLLVIALVVYSPWILHQLHLVSTGGAAALLDPHAPLTIHDLIYKFLPTVLQPLATAAVVFAVFQILRGNPARIGQALRKGLGRLFQVFLVGIVTGVLVGIGTLLLIVPGIILSLMFYVAVPAAVVERLGVGAAIRRSVELTRDRRWSVFGLVLLVGFLGGIPTMVVGMILGAAQVDAGVLLLVTTFLSLLVAMLGMTASAVAYHDLRVDKEGIDTNSLAAVFD